MTTEDDFQRQLDANPDDWWTRLVFADFLDERGDPRGPGYRALGRLNRKPHFAPQFPDDQIWHLRALADTDGASVLPPGWFELLPDLIAGATYWPDISVRKSRREAEDAAALAFARLPAERRAELLATEPTAAGHR